MSPYPTHSGFERVLLPSYQWLEMGILCRRDWLLWICSILPIHRLFTTRAGKLLTVLLLESCVISLSLSPLPLAESHSLSVRTIAMKLRWSHCVFMFNFLLTLVNRFRLNKEINEYNKIFSGRRLRQGVKGHKLRSHLQGGDGVSPWNVRQLSYLDATICPGRSCCILSPRKLQNL